MWQHIKTYKLFRVVCNAGTVICVGMACIEFDLKLYMLMFMYGLNGENK